MNRIERIARKIFAAINNFDEQKDWLLKCGFKLNAADEYALIKQPFRIYVSFNDKAKKVNVSIFDSNIPEKVYRYTGIKADSRYSASGNDAKDLIKQVVDAAMSPYKELEAKYAQQLDDVKEQQDKLLQVLQGL